MEYPYHSIPSVISAVLSAWLGLLGITKIISVLFLIYTIIHLFKGNGTCESASL